MAEIDPFKDPPLYEAAQVLTFADILGVRNGYVYQHSKTRWYEFLARFKFAVGVGVCDGMLHWLAHGKPMGGVRCEEGHDAV